MTNNDINLITLLKEYSILSRVVHFFEHWEHHKLLNLSKDFQRLFDHQKKEFTNFNKWRKNHIILQTHYHSCTFDEKSFIFAHPPSTYNYFRLTKFTGISDEINGLFFQLIFDNEKQLFLLIKSFYGFMILVDLSRFWVDGWKILNYANSLYRLPPYFTMSSTWRSYLIVFLNINKTFVFDYTDLSKIDVILDDFILQQDHSPFFIKPCEFFKSSRLLTCSYPNCNQQLLMKPLLEPLPQIKWYDNFNHHKSVANYVYSGVSGRVLYYFDSLRLVFVMKSEKAESFQSISISSPFIFPQINILIYAINCADGQTHIFIHHLKQTESRFLTKFTIPKDGRVTTIFYSERKNKFVVIRNSCSHLTFSIDDNFKVIYHCFKFTFPDENNITFDQISDTIYYTNHNVYLLSPSDLISTSSITLDSFMNQG